MIWIIVIVLIGLIIYLAGCKKPPIGPQPDPDPEPPEPPPIYDPYYWKWPKKDMTTERWATYMAGMNYITSDTLMALEMRNYKWVSDWDLFNKEDYWAPPDLVYENKCDDCDGLAMLSADGLGRFVKIPEVWWMEYYGYYRYYYYDKESDRWTYEVKLGGHAITVYKKDGKLMAFSNTSWWYDKDFQDYVSIGELTFPEGIVLIRCRHWDSGKLQWIQEAKQGEILEGSCIFNRDKEMM